MLRITAHSITARLAAICAAALLLVGLVATPASAEEPQHIVASVDGFGAATRAVTHERVGELDRYVVTNLFFGENRVHSRPGRPQEREAVCVSIDTYWLPADGSSDRYVATQLDLGCASTDGVVDVDVANLTHATLPETRVSLELAYCFSEPDWGSLCEGVPTERVVSIAAELTGVGEVVAARGRSREQLPFAPECIELDVYSNARRDGDGTLTLAGTASAADPYLTFIFDGRLFFNVICRV